MRVHSTTIPLALALSLAGVRAEAENLELHGTASLSTGLDSNPQSVPDEDDFTRQVAIAQQNELSEKQAAFLVQPTPGFVFDYLSPRLRFELIYSHPFFFYIGNEQANADADNAVFNLFYDVSPRTQTTFGLFFNRLNTGLSTLETAANTVIAARPGGDNTALAFGASQSLRHELSEFWRWEETANLGVFAPLASNQPIALIASASTGPEVRYGDHALALVPSVSYLHPFVENEAQAVELQYFNDHQLLATGALRWRWDWTLTFGSEASAGVSVLTNLEGELRVEPVGSAAVLYSDEGYAATLEYRRSFTPNIVTGQTYLADTASISGRFPIYPEADIAAQSSIGGAFTRAIDQRIELSESTAVTIIGDVAVGWFPEDFPNFSLRYQHIEQVAARYEAYRALPTFDRDLLLLSVSYTFPARTIKVPTGIPRRVDDSDQRQILGPQQEQIGPRSSGRP